jgi:hypothetical protein
MEKRDAGKDTTPEIALKETPGEDTATLTGILAPVLKLPVAGTMERVAAYTKSGEKANSTKKIIAEYALAILF